NLVPTALEGSSAHLGRLRRNAARVRGQQLVSVTQCREWAVNLSAQQGHLGVDVVLVQRDGVRDGGIGELDTLNISRSDGHGLLRHFLPDECMRVSVISDAELN